MIVARPVLIAVAALLLLLPSAEAASAPPVSVWFAPLPADPLCGCPTRGSEDYTQLFASNAPWKSAVKHVSAMKLPSGWVTYRASLPQLRRIAAFLKAHKLQLAVEAPALVADARTCGSGVEGFGLADEVLWLARRLKDAGLNLRYVALDEPFLFGTTFNGPTACHYTPEQVAQGIVKFTKRLQRFFPRVVVGDIEPLIAGVTPEMIASWLDAYRQVAGKPFAFFDLDLDYDRPDTVDGAKQLHAAVRDRGIPFGLIYIGKGETDAAWIASVEQRYVKWETETDLRPDRVIFQSWLDKPDYVLPESKPSTFTWALNRYFRPRPSVTLAVDGAARAVGTLLDASGRPLAGAPVTLTETPRAGPGVDSTLTISGTVPRGANGAVVGLRVNTECLCSAPSEFVLHRVSYTENGGGSVVPNASFSSGLASWGLVANGALARVEGDAGLHVSASPWNTVTLNSQVVPATEGAHFEATFSIRVAPSSHGSGFVTVMFLMDRVEFTRQMGWLEPAVVPLGRATTDAAGQFSVEVVPLGSQALVEARYDGDPTHFPAYASAVAP